MNAIIKTWPGFFSREKTLAVFTADWPTFYFTLGRGRPQRPIDSIFYTHQGEILGHFAIAAIVQNDGSLPKLRSISNQESEWQIRRDYWVAVCDPPFHPIEERLCFSGFRGWRYFDLKKYRGTLDAKIPL